MSSQVQGSQAADGMVAVTYCRDQMFCVLMQRCLVLCDRLLSYSNICNAL
jgi:hypothetical protein